MTLHPEESLNLVQIFLERAARYGHRDALRVKFKKRYRAISWWQWADEVKAVALGLSALGVCHGDRVAILSENRPEWVVADLAILSLGAVTVPLYPTSSANEIAHILKNSGAEILFVSTELLFEKIKSLLDRPDFVVRRTVLFEAASQGNEKLLSFQALGAQGKKAELNDGGRYCHLVESVKPEDLATLIYTSGTTGLPKGVMLTHHNLVANYLGAGPYIPISEDDQALSFLPLSHIFERLAGYYFMAFNGATISFAESMQTVPDDMLEVRPTVMMTVPRFYEKIYARILEKVAAGPFFLKKLFAWAVEVGREYRLRSKPCWQSKLKYGIADALIFRKIRAGLGGRIRFFVAGGAPMSKELAEFFWAAGILILEGYGLTETSPVIAVNPQGRCRFGTVGPALPNVQVRIAEDGEILTSGPCVMSGYYQNPEATAEALRDGWLHTGDIGELDESGYLQITDRKKDIIVTSGGKNVAPQNIENLILADPLFSQVVIVGDKRNYLVALFVLNRAEVERVAREKGRVSFQWPEVLKEASIREWVAGRLEERTKGLAPYEQIKYFSLLEREFSQGSGELTPTLKVRRRQVMENYREIIDDLYRRGDRVAPRETR